MKYYHIKIKGRVQGVGFRYSVRSKAEPLGIKGTIENLPDGDVEIFCYGTEDNMDRFLDLCRKNPGWSDVKDIEVEEIKDESIKEHLKRISDFRIIG